MSLNYLYILFVQTQCHMQSTQFRSVCSNWWPVTLLLVVYSPSEFLSFFKKKIVADILNSNNPTRNSNNPVLNKQRNETDDKCVALSYSIHPRIPKCVNESHSKLQLVIIDRNS